MNISTYADDHQIYQTGKGISTVHTKLEESASSATDWYENNLLEDNLKNYQTMFIQNKYGHMKEQFSCAEYNTILNLNGKIIRTSDSLKILGVTIDNKLNFNEHINDVCNKANQRVGVIMRLRNLIPTTAKLVLLKVTVDFQGCLPKNQSHARVLCYNHRKVYIIVKVIKCRIIGNNFFWI